MRGGEGCGNISLPKKTQAERIKGGMRKKERSVGRADEESKGGYKRG